MNIDKAQELQVKKDLAHLTRTLTPDNLNPSIMFSKKRNIRSCSPAIGSHPEHGCVAERLERVMVLE